MISLERQLRCAQRELQQRKRVYPRLVEQHKMLQSSAEDEICAQEAIIETLTQLLAAQEQQQALC